MKALPAVAVLGLGAMGHAFAANLLKKGFTVYGWNRTRGAAKISRARVYSCATTPDWQWPMRRWLSRC